MRQLFALLFVIWLALFQLLIHNSFAEIRNPNPKIELSLFKSEPLNDLYLENELVELRVEVKNISDEFIIIRVLGELSSVTPDSSRQIDRIPETVRRLAPDDSEEFTFNRPYFAGNYRLLVNAGVVNSTDVVREFIGQDAVIDEYFTIFTQQDLFTKRMADSAETSATYSVVSAIGAVLSAGAAIGIAIWSNRRANTQWSETKGEFEEDRKISRDAVKLTKEQLGLQHRITSAQEDLTEAQNMLVQTQKAQSESQLLLSLFGMLSSPHQRELRGEIFETYWAFYPDGIEKAKEKGEAGKMVFSEGSPLKNTVKEVTGVLDQAGVLVLNGLVKPELFFDMYAGIVVRTWKALEEDIEQDRAINDEVCKWFKQLYEEAKKYYKTKSLAPPEIYRRPRPSSLGVNLISDEKKDKVSQP